MNYDYDVNYTPPAPTLELYLSVPERDTTIGPLSGIIDTGADGTLIPTAHLKELRASPDERGCAGSGMNGVRS